MIHVYREGATLLLETKKTPTTIEATQTTGPPRDCQIRDCYNGTVKINTSAFLFVLVDELVPVDLNVGFLQRLVLQQEKQKQRKTVLTRQEREREQQRGGRGRGEYVRGL